METVNKITHISRSVIVMLFRGRELTVPGEAFERGYGSPDFVAYVSSLKTSESSIGAQSAQEATHEELCKVLRELMEERGMSIEFE